MGRNSRARVFRAALPCLALIVLTGTAASAQTVTPDLFSSTRTSQVTSPDSPLRRTAAEANDPLNSPKLQERDKPAPSRIGQIPKYGLPAASGAANSGYDSLNRKRKKPKYYPGQAKPKPPVGPGSPPPPVASNTRLRLSIPPSASAHKSPVPPAMAGTVVGQPPRKRLRIDDDPFGAVGDYAGSFLIKSAVELRGGYDTNPGANVGAAGIAVLCDRAGIRRVLRLGAPRCCRRPRGSFTGYTNNFPPDADGMVSSAPTNIDRPDFIGHVDGRLDVTRDTRLLGQARLRVATDNPGSPNVQAGLSRYPVYATFGGTFGVDQNFNRLQLSAGATVDRTDLSILEADRRHLDQQRRPQLQPVRRPRPRQLRRDAGLETVRRNRRQCPRRTTSGSIVTAITRNSSGGYVKGRHQFRVLADADRRSRGRLGGARLMTIRGCNRLQGLLTSASLVWVATPLTTAKFFADTSIDETTRARRLRRADAHLHRRSRPRFPPLAHRHRQIHLGHLSNTRATTASTRSIAVRRPDLQDEPQHLAQGHAAPRLAGFELSRATARHRR